MRRCMSGRVLASSVHALMAAAIVALTSLVSACDMTNSTASLQGNVAAAGQTPGSSFRAGQSLAQALGRAMGDPSVRAEVFTAMQDSRWNENKLLFQDFAGTPAGEHMLQVASAATGVQPGTLQAWLAQLPSLDFYIPVHQQRAEWQGAGDVVVGLNLDVDDPTLVAYTSRGEEVSLDSRDGIPSRVVFILHPAEPKYERSRGGKESSGTRVGSIAPGDGGGGGTSSSTRPGILKNYSMNVSDGWGDNEIMFKHYADTKLQTKLWEWVDSGAFFGQGRITDKATTLGYTSTVIRVWERDSGFPETGGDDYVGGGFLQNYSTTGDMLLIVHANCNPPYANDTNDTLFLQYCAGNVVGGDQIGSIGYDPQ
jgi:hypothetical protein